MKLRIKGNSIRLRILQGELDRLLRGETLEERLTFPAGQGSLTYRLTVGQVGEALDAAFAGGVMMVSLTPAALRDWAQPDQVGVYGEVATPEGPLSIAVEKDFACLDGSDSDNEGTFAHPGAETLVCS